MNQNFLRLRTVSSRIVLLLGIKLNCGKAMKVATGAAIVVTAVLFIGAKTGWFDARNIQSGDAMAANRIGSSAPSSAQKVPTNSSSDTAPEEPPETKKSDTVTGEAAREELRKSGQYESLGAAFQAARYAAEKIDPAEPHSRGAEYFASNPKQQLRAWFRHDGIELASGRHAKERSRGACRCVSAQRAVRAPSPRQRRTRFAPKAAALR